MPSAFPEGDYTKENPTILAPEKFSDLRCLITTANFKRPCWCHVFNKYTTSRRFVEKTKTVFVNFIVLAAIKSCPKNRYMLT